MLLVHILNRRIFSLLLDLPKSNSSVSSWRNLSHIMASYGIRSGCDSVIWKRALWFSSLPAGTTVANTYKNVLHTLGVILYYGSMLSDSARCLPEQIHQQLLQPLLTTKKCYIKNNLVNPAWLWDFCGTNKKRTVWNSSKSNTKWFSLLEHTMVPKTIGVSWFGVFNHRPMLKCYTTNVT